MRPEPIDPSTQMATGKAGVFKLFMAGVSMQQLAEIFGEEQWRIEEWIREMAKLGLGKEGKR